MTQREAYRRVTAEHDQLDIDFCVREMEKVLGVLVYRPTVAQWLSADDRYVRKSVYVRV